LARAPTLSQDRRERVDLNRQKYLAFINTCNEKQVIADLLANGEDGHRAEVPVDGAQAAGEDRAVPDARVEDPERRGLRPHVGDLRRDLGGRRTGTGLPVVPSPRS
jgi:hypothetical protein